MFICDFTGAVEQSLAADVAIACFSSNFFPSALVLIALELRAADGAVALFHVYSD